MECFLPWKEPSVRIVERIGAVSLNGMRGAAGTKTEFRRFSFLLVFLKIPSI